MAIENTLERIAIALEAIVKSKLGVEPMSADSLKKSEPGKTDTVKTEAPKTRPGKKVEEKTEATGGDDFYTEDEDPVDIKWPDVNKKLFGMLERVRDEESPEAAKATCAALMKKHSGGQKFGPGTVAPSSYKALLADIDKELESLNG